MSIKTKIVVVKNLPLLAKNASLPQWKTTGYYQCSRQLKKMRYDTDWIYCAKTLSLLQYSYRFPPLGCSPHIRVLEFGIRTNTGAGGTVWQHDDVIKWKHLPRYWPFVRGIHRSPVNSPHKGQWGGALMFTLIYAQINGWVNNHEAGDLRRHRAHYGVIVINLISILLPPDRHRHKGNMFSITIWPRMHLKSLWPQQPQIYCTAIVELKARTCISTWMSFV